MLQDIDAVLRAGEHVEVLAMDFSGHGRSRRFATMHTTRARSGHTEASWTTFCAADIAEAIAHAFASGMDGSDASGGGQRVVVGVGHSMGGAALVAAELAKPGTFDRLVLIEPIVLPHALSVPPQEAHQKQTAADHPVAAAVLRRRASWASGAEAAAYFHRKFGEGDSTGKTGRWDPRAVAAFAQGAVRCAKAGEGGQGGTLGEGRVVLCCAPHDEAAIYRGAPLPVSSARALQLRGSGSGGSGITLVTGRDSTWLDRLLVNGGAALALAGSSSASPTSMKTCTYYAWLARQFGRAALSTEGGAEGQSEEHGCELITEAGVGHLVVMEAPARVAHTAVCAVRAAAAAFPRAPPPQPVSLDACSAAPADSRL